MLREFKAFLFKENVLSLAVAVVMGGALTLLVRAVVDDFIMPVVGVVAPAGEWETMTWTPGPFEFGVGDFLAALLNFVVIGFVVWRISKVFMKPTADAPTKRCEYCRMSVDAAATRCPHCTSALTSSALTSSAPASSRPVAP